MEQSPAAVEVRKDETTRLYEALTDGRVVGNLTYETTGGRVTLTHSYVDPNKRHRVERRRRHQPFGLHRRSHRARRNQRALTSWTTCTSSSPPRTSCGTGKHVISVHPSRSLTYNVQISLVPLASR
jgi:hypothetical protein